jgi:hypothetical protein
MAQKRKLAGPYQVTVDLSRLSLTELEYLRSGIDSAVEARRQDDDSGRRWSVPSSAVEVSVE